MLLRSHLRLVCHIAVEFEAQSPRLPAMAFAVREWVAGQGAVRLWQALQSRVVLGVGYGVAALLTGVAILLAASPPST